MVGKFSNMVDGMGELADGMGIAIDKAGNMVNDVIETFKEDPFEKYHEMISVNGVDMTRGEFMYDP